MTNINVALAGEGNGQENIRRVLLAQAERVPQWKQGDYVRNICRGGYTGMILRQVESGVDIFRDDGKWDSANASDCERVSADEGRDLRAASAAKAEVRADVLRSVLAHLQGMLERELRVIKMCQQANEDTN